MSINLTNKVVNIYIYYMIYLHTQPLGGVYVYFFRLLDLDHRIKGWLPSGDGAKTFMKIFNFVWMQRCSELKILVVFKNVYMTRHRWHNQNDIICIMMNVLCDEPYWCIFQTLYWSQVTLHQSMSKIYDFKLQKLSS